MKYVACNCALSRRPSNAWFVGCTYYQLGETTLRPSSISRPACQPPPASREAFESCESRYHPQSCMCRPDPRHGPASLSLHGAASFVRDCVGMQSRPKRSGISHLQVIACRVVCHTALCSEDLKPKENASTGTFIALTSKHQGHAAYEAGAVNGQSKLLLPSTPHSRPQLVPQDIRYDTPVRNLEYDVY